MAIKLHEIGPRLRLRLVKIEEGVCRGNVVYHAYVKKSKKEIKEQFDDVKKKRDLKAERKRIQDENVKRKQAEKDAKEATKKGYTKENENDDEDESEDEDGFSSKKRDKKGKGKKSVGFKDNNEEYNDI